MRLPGPILLGVALLSGCSGPEPGAACLEWLRAGCTYLQGCGQVADVDQCVTAHQQGTDAEKICPSYLTTDAYCSDLGDDFLRCAEEVKSKACNEPDATLCILYTSSRSQCPVPDRFD